MFKNISRIVTVIALLALALSACAPAATPKATVAPATVAPVTVAPATSAPATVVATTARLLPQAPLLLPLAAGAPMLKSSSSPAEHPVRLRAGRL